MKYCVGDTYYDNETDIIEHYCVFEKDLNTSDEILAELKSLKICHTKEIFAEPLTYDDVVEPAILDAHNWNHDYDLPDMPEEVGKAFDALNEALKKWHVGFAPADPVSDEDLRKMAKDYVTKDNE